MQHQLLRLSFFTRQVLKTPPPLRLVPVPKTLFFDSCPCLRPPFFGLYPCLRPSFFGLCPCLRPPFLDVLRHTPTSSYRECPPGVLMWRYNAETNTVTLNVLARVDWNMLIRRYSFSLKWLNHQRDLCPLSYFLNVKCV